MHNGINKTGILKKFFIVLQAARAPFLTVFILPFICGSLIEKGSFYPLRFWLGLGAIVFSGAAANLFNDYADAKSRADWQDTRHYHFSAAPNSSSKASSRKVFFSPQPG